MHFLRALREKFRAPCSAATTRARRKSPLVSLRHGRKQLLPRDSGSRPARAEAYNPDARPAVEGDGDTARRHERCPLYLQRRCRDAAGAHLHPDEPYPWRGYGHGVSDAGVLFEKRAGDALALPGVPRRGRADFGNSRTLQCRVRVRQNEAAAFRSARESGSL